MSWLFQLHHTHAVAHAIGVIALVCSAGMALGSLKIRGIGLGTSGVLFAAIVAGHLGAPVDHEMLEFVKELGLVLFVFTIGLQLGPGFFAALREAGVLPHALAAGVVWALLYYRSKSLWGPWLSHAIVDAGIFAIGYDLVM